MLTNLKGVQKKSAAIMTYQKHVCEMLKLAHYLWETHVEIPQKIGREMNYLLTSDASQNNTDRVSVFFTWSEKFCD